VVEIVLMVMRVERVWKVEVVKIVEICGKSEKGGERVKAGEDVIKSVAGIVYMLSRILKYSSLLIPTVFILVRIIVTVTSSYLGMITGLRAFGWLNIK